MNKDIKKIAARRAALFSRYDELQDFIVSEHMSRSDPRANAIETELKAIDDELAYLYMREDTEPKAIVEAFIKAINL